MGKGMGFQRHSRVGRRVGSGVGLGLRVGGGEGVQLGLGLVGLGRLGLEGYRIREVRVRGLGRSGLEG